MSVPPPILRDLESFEKSSSSSAASRRLVWEIGVPVSKSLYWSIMLAYLLAVDNIRFSGFIEGLKTAEPSNSKKKNLCVDVNVKSVKTKLKNFNPFLNRHTYFRDSKVMTAFSMRLKKHASNTRTAVEYEDECKLNAACNMLNCSITVYYPDSPHAMSPKTYRGKTNELKIVLFQYRDQMHGQRITPINVFRFAMEANEHACGLKLKALSHFLKKAKLTTQEIDAIKRIVKGKENHGERVLLEILYSAASLIPKIYASPYIAFKLSEAGFETNPVSKNLCDLGLHALVFVAAAKSNARDLKCLEILYQYTANCRHRFDGSVRDPTECVLDNLKTLKNTLDRSIEILREALQDEDLQKDSEQFNLSWKAVRLLEQYYHFSEYQENLVSDLLNIRGNGDSGSMPSLAVITKILEFYLSYFHYGKKILLLELPAKELSQTYLHSKFYNSWLEYYRNLDQFACLSFLDSLYALQKVIQIKSVDIYDDIQSSFFLLTVSFNFFNQNESHEKLELITIIFREALLESICCFLNELKNENNFVSTPKETPFLRCLSRFPKIKDHTLVKRVSVYMQAAVNVSISTERVKGILCIERALQVLGESIKPQSTEHCVSSILLCSCLSPDILKILKALRNDFSKYRANSVMGRLDIETNNVKFFEDIQKELSEILDEFEDVFTSQYFQTEQFLINHAKDRIGHANLLPREEAGKFRRACEKASKSYDNEIEKYRLNFNRLFVRVINYLFDFIAENVNATYDLTKEIDKILDSIDFVLTLVQENDRDLYASYVDDIKVFVSDLKSCENVMDKIEEMRESFKSHVRSMREEILLDFKKKTYPNLLSFLPKVKGNSLFSDEDLNDITGVVKTACKSAEEAKRSLRLLLEERKSSPEAVKNVNFLLSQLIVSNKALDVLKNYIIEKKWDDALLKLDKLQGLAEDSLANKIRGTFAEDTSLDSVIRIVLLKIAYQGNLEQSIYPSSTLSVSASERLKKYFSSKIVFLIDRISKLKFILIEENEEFTEIWVWGKTIEIRDHLKYLIRQKYLLEAEYRAALETAYFECLNVLTNEDFSDIYKKANYLYTGINVRDYLAHGHNILDVVGGLLDKDDLPNEIINKSLELIGDLEAIEAIYEIWPSAGTLELNSFKIWLESQNTSSTLETTTTTTSTIEKIFKCKEWQKYLSFMPLY